VRVHDLSVPENLSRVSWKLSRTVLRGGTNSNVGPLLDLQLGPQEKQPYSIGMANDSVFAFAGLWDRWLDQNNNPIETCTIITTKPNSLVADVHDRMPVILRPEDYDRWLDPGITDSQRVVDCLRPFDSTLMKKYPASTHVNRPENDDQECAKEIPIADTAPQLF
jgi:putative SOS response-associated peptidase YedK